MDIKFEGPYGVYHSNYDSYYWMDHFGDPNGTNHEMAAKTVTLMALRLANLDILPFDYTTTGFDLTIYIHQLEIEMAAQGFDGLMLDVLYAAARRLSFAAKKLEESKSSVDCHLAPFTRPVSQHVLVKSRACKFMSFYN